MSCRVLIFFLVGQFLYAGLTVTLCKWITLKGNDLGFARLNDVQIISSLLPGNAKRALYLGRLSLYPARVFRLGTRPPKFIIQGPLFNPYLPPCMPLIRSSIQ